MSEDVHGLTFVGQLELLWNRRLGSARFRRTPFEVHLLDHRTSLVDTLPLCKMFQGFDCLEQEARIKRYAH